MAVYKLIANGSFGPDEIEAMSAAYDATCDQCAGRSQDRCRVVVVALASLSVSLGRSFQQR